MEEKFELLYLEPNAAKFNAVKTVVEADGHTVIFDAFQGYFNSQYNDEYYVGILMGILNDYLQTRPKIIILIQAFFRESDPHFDEESHNHFYLSIQLANAIASKFSNTIKFLIPENGDDIAAERMNFKTRPDVMQKWRFVFEPWRTMNPSAITVTVAGKIRYDRCPYSYKCDSGFSNGCRANHCFISVLGGSEDRHFAAETRKAAQESMILGIEKFFYDYKIHRDIGNCYKESKDDVLYYHKISDELIEKAKTYAIKSFADNYRPKRPTNVIGNEVLWAINHEFSDSFMDSLTKIKKGEISGIRRSAINTALLDFEQKMKILYKFG